MSDSTTTSTLESFINYKNLDSNIYYKDLSIFEKSIDGKSVLLSYNILNDYRKEIFDFVIPITLTNEEDRLVLSGKFKKGESVSFILRKGLTNYYYDQVISKKPYTALCVDIFTEEETNEGINITRYINKEGLSGKYYLYIKINDKIYDTKRYVVV